MIAVVTSWGRMVHHPKSADCVCVSKIVDSHVIGCVHRRGHAVSLRKIIATYFDHIKCKVALQLCAGKVDIGAALMCTLGLFEMAKLALCLDFGAAVMVNV